MHLFTSSRISYEGGKSLLYQDSHSQTSSESLHSLQPALEPGSAEALEFFISTVRI